MLKRAGIYVRISDDTEGQGLGVKRQEADCRALASRLGWEVAGVYCDNDTSNFTRRARPSYQRLLAELDAGGLTGLLVWDTDRLTRHPVELEHVIDLAERRGLALASVGGEIDLATPQGRLTARIKASVARHEVEQSSRRIKRQVFERAEAGKPHGRVAYGWRRVDGRDVVNPEEARVVHEISTRIAAGESVRSVSLDLERRGVRSPQGLTRWHPVTLRQLVLRARNAGLRLHQRRVIGRGNWEPIVEEDLYHRVCAVLADPARRTSPTGARRYLLSGIARCGRCGEAMRIVKGTKRDAAYICPGCFKVRRKQTDVDDLITQLVIARLTQPDAAAALTPEKADTTELITEAGALRARLDLAADQYADDLIDASQLARITAKLRPRLTELEEQIKATDASPELTDLATDDIARRWHQIPLERQRATINALMQITIMPVGRGNRGRLTPEAIQITWRHPANP